MAVESYSSAGQSSERGIIVFILGDYKFGINIEKATEIVWMVEIARLPNTPHFMEGIIDVRGRIIPVINMRNLFRLGARPFAMYTQIILVRHGGTELGIIADDIHDIITVGSGRLSTSFSPSVPGHQFLDCVAEMEGELIPVLDIEKMLTFERQEVMDIYDAAAAQADAAAGGEPDARQPLDVELKKLFHRRAADLRAREKTEQTTNRYLVFLVNDEYYGIRESDIKEIVECSRIVPVPGLPDIFEGIVSVRGDIFSIINFEKLLGLEEKAGGGASASYLVLFYMPEFNAGFRLRNIVEIIELPLDMIQSKVSVKKGKYDYWEGIGKWDENLVGILNVQNILMDITIQ